MVTTCCAFGCSNDHKKGSNIHFFRFPFKNPELLNKWISAVKRENWEPKAHSRICSVHFTESDYQIRPGAGYPLLKITAVPSLFPAFSTHYKFSPKKARASEKQSSVGLELKQQTSKDPAIYDSAGPSELKSKKTGRQQLINELEQQTSEDPVTSDSDGLSELTLKERGRRKLMSEVEQQTSEDLVTSDSDRPSEPTLKKRGRKKFISEVEEQTSEDLVTSDSDRTSEPTLKKKRRKKFNSEVEQHISEDPVTSDCEHPSEQAKLLIRRNKCLTQKIRRQKKKIETLKTTLIASLKEKGLSDPSLELLLLEKFCS
ncbi:peroxynitrite isomerase THAP4-like [Harmonia axyridis]|uniref:peroxynitrite isomerase THAP4-like n=1 Tax=Harmonia axyridis TaxID=115357 RepID=UPI001E27644D|nr:peroxynitrite isomerase THAP4-like [Harmonia axyridis]